MKAEHSRCFTVCFVALLWSIPIVAQSNSQCVANPDWGIFVTDFGYADTMVDLRQLDTLDLRGREYLSGEWAQAVGYSKSAVNQGPIWLEKAAPTIVKNASKTRPLCGRR